MDASFNGTDSIDVNTMFDQYLYKRNNENIDVSLSIPQYHNGHHHHHHPNQPYDMNDQTFHTPSFGDEDFEIPNMNAHMQHGGGHHQMDVHHYKMHGNGPAQHNNMAMTNEQQYNQWQLDQQQMAIRNNSAYQMQSPSHSVYSVSSPSNNSQQQQQQLLLMQPPQRSPQMQSQISPQMGGTGTYVGRSPPQSGQTPSTENGTSDDSDDNAAIPTNTLKRPSPEPYGSDSPNGSNSAMKNAIPPAKKPKATKKKKKRDPNEPQKPVSAYALFFRDTQAAIKGQNPNASFGEVSKIVASMWDVLATEHKNVYKKKTEAAKKEYLKALSEYRAGLVSKGTESDQSQPQPMYSPPPQQAQQTQSHIVQHPQRSSPQRVSPGVGPIPHSPHLPMQGAPMPQNTYQQTYQQTAYKPPQQIMQMQQHHNSHGQQSPQMMGHPMNAMMGQMNPPQQQQQQQQMNNQNMNSMMGGGQHQQYMNQQIHPQQQQQHHLMSGQMSPQAVPPMSGSPPSQAQTPHCIRHGCPNKAIVNSDWEDEYCSNECVITHCRDVFGNWVQTNNTQQHTTYSAVK